jgi:16S rRNA (guanine527-N7)-methyltransferase
VVDIGAGGGFPGLVLGCLRPDLELLLVEPRRRARSFLAEVLRSISLPKGRAIEARGEDLATDATVKASARLVISRALRIDLFLPLAAPLLAPDGIAVAMQTPSLKPPAASALGASADLALRQVRDYQLPDGERRRLVVFTQR